MKKLLCLVLALCMVIMRADVTAFATQANAEQTAMIEPDAENDTVDAEDKELNIRGEIALNDAPISYIPVSEDAESHEVYFSIEVLERGYLTVTGTCERRGWFKIYDEELNWMASCLWGDDATVTSDKIGVEPGTYYVDWENFPLGYEGTFSAEFVASEEWESEPNNTKETADIIRVNTTYNGKNPEDCYGSYEDMEEYYTFTTEKAGYVTIDFAWEMKPDAETVFPQICLYNEADRELCYGYSQDIAEEKLTTKEVGLAAGTYYIKCFNRGSNISAYTIKVNWTESDCWEQEENDTVETATPLTLNTEYSGRLGLKLRDTSAGYGGDWYTFELNSAGVVNLEFKHPFLEEGVYSDHAYSLFLYGSDGESLYESIKNATSETFYTGTKFGLPEGKYYVYVTSGAASNVGIYNLKVNYTESNEWETEKNNTWETADEIALNTTYNGTWTELDVGDYYKLVIDKAGYVSIELKHDDTGFDWGYCYALIMDESNEKYIQRLESKGADTDKTSEKVYLEKGIYRLSISRYAEVRTTPYQFTVHYTENDENKDDANKDDENTMANIMPPVISSVKSASYNSIKVSWQKTANAEKYYIYRSTSQNGTYKLIKTVSAGTTSFTDTKLITGRTYYYKIKSGGSGKTSSFSAVKSAKPVPATVKVTLSAVKKKQMKLSWKKIAGASGYEVYRSTSKNGKYTKVKTISKGSTVTYKDKKVKSKKKYYYKVRAYKKVNGKKVYGNYSKVTAKKTK